MAVCRVSRRLTVADAPSIGSLKTRLRAAGASVRVALAAGSEETSSACAATRSGSHAPIVSSANTRATVRAGRRPWLIRDNPHSTVRLAERVYGGGPAGPPPRLTSVRGLHDLRVLVDLDAVALRSSHDLASRLLLGVLALEVGLAEARDGIADVRLVVDWQVLSAVAVDVRKLVAIQVLASLCAELRHRNPPVRACPAWRAGRVPGRSILGEEGVVAVELQPASPHLADGGDHRLVIGSRRQERGDRAPHRLGALHAEQHQVIV